MTRFCHLVKKDKGRKRCRAQDVSGLTAPEVDCHVLPQGEAARVLVGALLHVTLRRARPEERVAPAVTCENIAVRLRDDLRNLNPFSKCRGVP